MAVRRLTRVLQDIRKAALHEADASSDGQLLAQFVEKRDESAFAALVKRHSGMVWGVCRRRLAHHHDAEDAFQATFLVLARKAASVKPRDMVANWLHGVAHRTALKAMTMAGKRRLREKQVMTMPEPEAVPPIPWPDLDEIIDQELAALPDKYRIVILLCDLEGKTGREAARQLEIPEGTLAGRLRTGRIILAKRLARHGLVFSGGALATALAQNAASAAVPTAVVSLTIKAATLVAAGKTVAAGMISAPVAALTEGVLKAMFLTKLKQAVGVVLLLSVLSLGGAVVTQHTAIGQQPATAERRELPPPAKIEPRATAKEVAAPKTDKERLQGVWAVVAMEMDGKPVAMGKMVFMVDGNRACWQTSEEEIHGGFYLDSTTEPKSYDLATTARTFEGIYSIEGKTLRLCYRLGDEGKRPDRFTAPADSQRVLVTLKRMYHGKDVFPFRLADGSRAFPKIVEPAKKAIPQPPAIQAPPPVRAEPVRYSTPNFVVVCTSDDFARAIGDRAELERKRLGKQWLGQEPPRWKQPCLIHVALPKGKKPNGFASFAYEENRRYGPKQEVWLEAQGVQDLMPDVLPQQLMHTLLAHELGAGQPRWIESGAGLMVQSDEAKNVRLAALREALADGKTMSLAKLFALRSYPEGGDLNTWYAQCLSVCQFLVDRKDRATLLAFVQRGMERGWDDAARRHYGFADLLELDAAWRKSVRDSKGAEERAATPPQKASRARVVYNVADLVVPIPGLDGNDGAKTKESWLIQKITRTIAPRTWKDQGGTGSIEYFPMGLALVINQSPEIQSRVNQLLESLRRFQDIQVAIETRVVTIRKESLPNLRNVLANLKVDGHLILNEAEMFALLEKSKAEKGSSVLQAPKATLFPGQRAELSQSALNIKLTAMLAANLHHVELNVKAKAGQVEWTKSTRLASEATLVLAAVAGDEIKLLLVTPRVVIALEETVLEGEKVKWLELTSSIPAAACDHIP